MAKKMGRNALVEDLHKWKEGAGKISGVKTQRQKDEEAAAAAAAKKAAQRRVRGPHKTATQIGSEEAERIAWRKKQEQRKALGKRLASGPPPKTKSGKIPWWYRMAQASRKKGK